MRDGSAEDGHHRVADELLHRAAEALELVAQAGVVRAEERAHLLRIHLLGARREAHEIGEEDGDDLAFLEPRFLLGSQRPAAGVAEARSFGVLLTAAGAREHHAEAYGEQSNGSDTSGLAGSRQGIGTTFAQAISGFSVAVSGLA